MLIDIVPGAFVRHPDRPDWGVGQVQSVIGDRVTVNFEHQGKQMINAAVVALVPVADPDAGESPSTRCPGKKFSGDMTGRSG